MIRQRTVVFVLSGLAMLPALGGCVASLEAEPAYVEASYVPAHIEVYPRTYYEGRTVYLVDNRWYYHDGARWAYYQQEPEPLYRHRTYIHQAPPANRRYVASPPVRTAPAAVAPPARRVQRVRRNDDHADRREYRSNDR